MNAPQDPFSARTPLASFEPGRAPPATAGRILGLFHGVGVSCTALHAEAGKDGPEALASALGCEAPQIALTSIFRGKTSRKPFLLVHAASTAVSEKVLSQMVGETIQRADADFVTRYSGFHADAIAPLGLSNRMPIILDSSLTHFAHIWISLGEREWYAAVPALVLARAISARIVSLTA